MPTMFQRPYLGDFIVITSRKPFEVLKLKSPSKVEFALVLLKIKFNTSLARSVLPKKIDLSSIVYNVSRAATFIAGIALNYIEVMGRGMADTVIEPARAHLIPGLNQVKKKL